MSPKVLDRSPSPALDTLEPFGTPQPCEILQRIQLLFDERLLRHGRLSRAEAG